MQSRKQLQEEINKLQSNELLDSSKGFNHEIKSRRIRHRLPRSCPRAQERDDEEQKKKKTLCQQEWCAICLTIRNSAPNFYVEESPSEADQQEPRTHPSLLDIACCSWAPYNTRSKRMTLQRHGSTVLQFTLNVTS